MMQVLPLPKVRGIWKHRASRYPDVIRVPMSDGKVVKYVIDIEQPHPAFLESMRIIGRMAVGYQKGREKK